MRPTGDHFYTTSAPERDNALANIGYVSENVACWVPVPVQGAVRAPLYRLWNPGSSDHFYTTSAPERDKAIANAGYVAEGVACEVYSAAQPGSVPLYRLWNPGSGDHFYTTSAPERDAAVANAGYVSEGIAGWVPSAAAAGTVPLHRLWNSGSGDHFYTTSVPERDAAIANAGYVLEGVACQVLTAQVTSQTPLHRLLNAGSGDHFYTTSAPERDAAIAHAGYASEGVACEVFAAPEPGTVELYRLYNSGNADHFYTTSAPERDAAVANAGYVFEGVACYVFAGAGPGRDPLHRLYKVFGAALDANIILVGVENFTAVNQTKVGNSLQRARDIYAKVGLQIRTVTWWSISAAEAGANETIDSEAEASDLTSDWTVPNHALDLFVVRAMNGADGWSAVNGSCDKDSKGMTGSVVSLNGSTANSGNTFAHEMGHYLGLSHIAETGNFIGGDGASNSWTGIHEWQGDQMAKHCFVYEL
jgi:hypothetical protein